MIFLTLGTYKGWTIKWDPSSHKMFTETSGLFGSSHDFYERPNDRVTAYEIAKAWIDGRR
jgi:hypothetical protein